MIEGWTPHRKRNPRTCDRCRCPASWNLARKGFMLEYACEIHAVDLARRYRIDPPRTRPTTQG